MIMNISKKLSLSLMLMTIASQAYTLTSVDKVMNEFVQVESQKKLEQYHQANQLLKAFSLNPRDTLAVVDGTGGYFIELIDKVVQLKGGKVIALNDALFFDEQSHQSIDKLQKSNRLRRTDFLSKDELSKIKTPLKRVLVFYGVNNTLSEPDGENSLATFNEIFFDKLAENGMLGIVDFSAKDIPAESEEANDFSRVNVSWLEKQILPIGFKKMPGLTTLSNALDAREHDAKYQPEQFYPDRFVLRFAKFDDAKRPKTEELANWD